MTKFRPYSKCKDSGIDWLGTIPVDWTIVKTGHVTRLTTGWTPPTGDSDAYIGDNLWANISDLGPKLLQDTAKRISNEAAAAARIARSREGSLLFSFKLSVGQVSFAGTDMYTNEAIATFEDTARLSTRFAYYALPIYLIQNANENIYGAKLLNQDLMKAAHLCLPDKSVQERIADFLDRETAQIDDLIDKQERLIELLAEKRQATITHAVTKGLDPAAPTKSSGLPWLGDIPAHWYVRKFSQVTLINGGQVDPRNEPWASMLLIAPNHIAPGTGRLISRETATKQGADSGKYVVKAGQVIYSKIRPYLRKVAIAPEDCLCSADMYGISASQSAMSNRFLQELMLSQPFTDFTADSSARVAMPKINRESLGQGFLWYPSRAEQDQIVNYIDRESQTLDRLEDKARQFIELLRERRSALIYAAVTGKLDVREGAA